MDKQQHKLVKAINFATEAHKDQRRKDSKATPYITHPIEVMYFLSEAGITDVDILCSAVLHDVIEDTPVTKEELFEQFGENVTNMVLECSDDKSDTKVNRKKHQIEHASQISTGAKLVKLADKYSNVRGLGKNPPHFWSEVEIRGYICWAYKIVTIMAGVNEYIDEKFRILFDNLFFQFNIVINSDDDLQKELENYYSHIESNPGSI
jgi:guanosine-3',5'-bis(diphosphate) 3'-pyrophosphohydrolase